MMTANDFGAALVRENCLAYEEFRVSVSKFPSNAKNLEGTVKEGIRIQYPVSSNLIGNQMRASSNCKYSDMITIYSYLWEDDE